MIKEAIANIVAGIDLTQLEASEVMVEIMEGEATDAQLSAFLVALRMKGETVNEISGLAMTMRDKALSLEISNPSSLLDTCGTGGDSLSTFNISTAAALVAAGAKPAQPWPDPIYVALVALRAFAHRPLDSVRCCDGCGCHGGVLLRPLATDRAQGDASF